MKSAGHQIFRSRTWQAKYDWSKLAAENQAVLREIREGRKRLCSGLFIGIC
jgi:hypothetical protein